MSDYDIPKRASRSLISQKAKKALRKKNKKKFGKRKKK
jgi:hypothetical protein